MLRDFQYNPAAAQISAVLQYFELDSQAEKSPLDVLRFEVLSPDSFMWKLLLGSAVYYLYAEDYVQGIDYIKGVFDDYLQSDKWDFVLARQTLTFESSSPVAHAKVYQKPERADELMKYAVDSGYDFVFLVKTLENPDDAHFPRNHGIKNR